MNERAPIPWGRTALASGLTVAAIACTIATETTPIEQPAAVTVQATPNTQTDCPAPSASDTAAVTRLFAQPQDEVFDWQTHGGPGYPEGITRMRGEKAQSLGLHTYDDRQLLQNPISLRLPSYQMSTAEALASTRSYMNLLGVSVEIGIDPKTVGYNSQNPTQQELQTKTARDDIENIKAAFFEMPSELVALAGLKHFRLVTGTKDGVAAYAARVGNEGTIYLDIRNSLSPEASMHEFAHELNAAECGGSAGHDAAFTNLATVANPYGKRPVKSLTGNWVHDTAEVISEEDLNATNPNPKAFCDAKTKEWAIDATIQTYSDYHPNVLEDKAEMGKNILIPGRYIRLTDPHFTVLYAKFRMLFARLFHLSPTLATYYAETNQRTGTDGAQEPSC
jgi:hypothetical protein